MDRERNLQTKGVLEHPHKDVSGAHQSTSIYPNAVILPFPSHERRYHRGENELQANSTITEGNMMTTASATQNNVPSLRRLLNFAPVSFSPSSSSLPPNPQSHSAHLSPDDLTRARSHNAHYHLHQHHSSQQEQQLGAAAVADLGSSHLHHFQLSSNTYHQRPYAQQTVSAFPYLSSGGPNQSSRFAPDQQPPQEASRAALPSTVGASMFPVGSGASPQAPSFRSETETISLSMSRAAPMLLTPTLVPIPMLSQPMQHQHQHQPVVFGHRAVPTYNTSHNHNNNNDSNIRSAMHYDPNNSEVPHQIAKYSGYGEEEATVPSASSLYVSPFSHSFVPSFTRTQPHISSFATQSLLPSTTEALSFQNANNSVPMLINPSAATSRMTSSASAAAMNDSAAVHTAFFNPYALSLPAATSSSLATTVHPKNFVCPPSPLTPALGISNSINDHYQHNNNNYIHAHRHASNIIDNNIYNASIASSTNNGGGGFASTLTSAAFASSNRTSFSQAAVSPLISISLRGGTAAAAATSFASLGAPHSPSLFPSSNQVQPHPALHPPQLPYGGQKLVGGTRVMVGAGEGTVMGFGASSSQMARVSISETTSIRMPVDGEAQARKEPSTGARGNETRANYQSNHRVGQPSKAAKESRKSVNEKRHAASTAAKTLLSSPNPSSKEGIKEISQAMSTLEQAANSSRVHADADKDAPTPIHSLPPNSPMPFIQHLQEITDGVCAEKIADTPADASAISQSARTIEQIAGKEKKSSARHEKGVQRISSDDEALLLFPEGDGATKAVKTSSLGKKSPLLFRTQLCNFYERHNFCRFIKTCVFAHGPDELRTVEMNERDGLTTKDALDAFIARGDAAREEQIKNEED